MDNYLQPPKSEAAITPYSQKIFQFGTDDSRLYLPRNANIMLRAFTIGYDENEYDTEYYDSTSLFDIGVKKYNDRIDCILDGFLSYHTIDNNLLTVVLGPGNSICDSTMITCPQPSTISLDLTVYDDSGFIVLAMRYKYIETVYNSPPRLRLSYVSSDGLTVLPGEPENPEWRSDFDRMIITTFKFVKDTENNVISVSNFLSDPFLKLHKTFVTVKENLHEIAPLPNFWYRLMRGVQINHPRRIVFNITDHSNWMNESPPFDAPDSNGYYYYPIDITNIGNKDCLIQCFINNVKIEPSAVQLYDEDELRIWMPDYWVTNSPPDIKVIIVG
jgi:hypothetical protein